MQISSGIAQKYWTDAAIEEYATRYRDKGYEIVKEAKLGDYRADLVIRKDNELLVFEFKLGDWPDNKVFEVHQLRNEVVHRYGGKFNIVLVAPPNETNIQIDDIDSILGDIIRDNLGDLDSLSSHTYIEYVSDVTITSIDISNNEMYVQGFGSVSVELNWGSSSDQENDEGASASDSFPFSFRIILDGNLKVVEVESLQIDVSSFYE